MRVSGKRWVIFLSIFFLLSLAVHSATQTISVVEPSKEQAPQKTTWEILKPFVITGLIIIVILGLLIWLVIWIMKKIKEGKDVWYKITKDKKTLCKMHSDKWRIHAFFKFRKNCPIRVYYTNSTQIHSKVVGYYRGHYISRDGNITMMFNCRRKWLVFPRNDLLIINAKKEIVYPKKVTKLVGNKMEMVIESETVPLPQNLVTFNPDEVILNAYSIDMDYRTEFFVPVLKDREGNIINMALPTYESMKQVAIEGYLYDQTDDFVKVAKKSIDLNPLIRGVNKVSDSSSSIETQQGMTGKG